MRKVLILALLLVSSAAMATQAEDEAAIRQILDSQAAAWKVGDANAFSKHVSRSVAFTNVFGVVAYGLANFEKRHHLQMSTFYKNTTKVWRIRQLRFATPDVAIVDIDNEIHGVKSMPAGITVPPDGIVRTQLMQVFVRHDGQWWVEAYHNVDVKPSAAASK